MTTIPIAWKRNVDWKSNVEKVIVYYLNGDHEYGPSKQNKALPLLDELCNLGCATREHLKTAHKLPSNDAMLTILSNVTMALQKGAVLSPEDGGWYVTLDDPYSYVVCPEFCIAWKQARS